MKKILAVLLVLFTAMMLFTACGEESDSQPLPAKVVSVNNVDDLIGLKNYLGPKYKNYVFELTADIDLSGIERWEPIGSDIENAFMATLSGKSKGQSHTIKNLTVKGVAEDGQPLFIAQDMGKDFVTSFASYGLFGYTKDAKLTDLTLKDVHIEYYADYNGYSYTAGLVGYDYGASTFDNISVDGSIAISNLYKKYVSYNVDDREGNTDIDDTCTTTLFIGGVVGCSTGDPTFKDVHSTVNMTNNCYTGYYRTRQNASSDLLEEGAEPFTEGYVVEYQSQSPTYKVDKVLSGGVVGKVDGGKMTEVSYTGSMDYNARSVYAAGIAGVATGVEISGATATGLNVVSLVSGKNMIAGLVSDIGDGAKLSGSTVTGATIKASGQGTPQKITVGGVFGYAVNLATIEDVTVTGSSFTVDNVKSVTAGGLGGTMRDATIKNCVSVATNIVGNSKDEKDYNRIGTVLGEAEGNTTVSDIHATATVVCGRGAAQKAIETAVAHVENFAFFNEDGKPCIRLYRKGTNSVYLNVDGEIEGQVLTINIYNEELSVLVTASYTLEGEVQNTDNPALTYLNDYFTAGGGFKNDNSGAVTLEDRDMTQYEYRAGVVVVTDVDDDLSALEPNA